MLLYLTHAQYSAVGFKGMVTVPSDRGSAAKELFESLGIKTHSIHYVISSAEIVCMLDSTAEQMAVVEMVMMTSGAFTGIRSLELITIREMNFAMVLACSYAGDYSAPN